MKKIYFGEIGVVCVVKKKNVDEIMRRLYSDYCITLGDSIREKKKYPNNDWLEGLNTGRLNYIESICCSVFGIDFVSKEGKSFRRNLRKKAKKSDLYKKYSKQKKGYVST